VVFADPAAALAQGAARPPGRRLGDGCWLWCRLAGCRQ